MKNIILLFALLLSFVVAPLCAEAQRFGTTASQDNTYRPLNLSLVTYVLKTGVDTLKLKPNAFETHIRCSSTLSDSLAIQVTSVTNCKLGDKIYLQVRSDASTRKLKLVGNTTFVTGSTTSISLAANKSAILTFYFDGSRWLEASRFVQP
jgi:hypothetical protein